MNKKYLVMRILPYGEFAYVKSYEREMDAWCYLGEMEHNICETANPPVTYEEANKQVMAAYRIFEPVC